MNNRRSNNQRQQHYQQNRYQHSNQFSRLRSLEYERDRLERMLAGLDAEIDVLREKGMLLEAAKQAHMRHIPGAIAQVVLSNIGVGFLPPLARNWQYRHQQYLRTEEQLKHHALSLYTRRNALIAQLQQIEVQIDMLQYQP